MKVLAEELQRGLMQAGAVWDGAPRVVGTWDDFELRVAVVVIEVAACVGDGATSSWSPWTMRTGPVKARARP
jgi:hypothetical protein